MRVLLDTDVVLDLVLDREPFADAAAELLALHEQERIEIFVSGITLINVFYVTRKIKGIGSARQAVEELLTTVKICPLYQAVLESAYKLPLTDYEDAVQHASATASQLDAIVTRNLKDYKNATLPVFSPTDFLIQLK